MLTVELEPVPELGFCLSAWVLLLLVPEQTWVSLVGAALFHIGNTPLFPAISKHMKSTTDALVRRLQHL